MVSIRDLIHRLPTLLLVFMHVSFAKRLSASLSLRSIARKFQAHLAEALRIVAPVLSYLDEEEKVNRLF